MRRETITESKATTLELTSEEADALNAAGERLASDRSWWGASEEDEDRTRSVIRCRPKGTGRYQVTVSSAVGVVSVDDLVLHVEPKIPDSHFLYLASWSDYYPRLDEQDALLEGGEDLFSLMARWFVQATEDLLRRDLIKDYSGQQDFLTAKRGRIRPRSTAQAIYRGRIGFDCEFDEFSRDIPLNRIVRAAGKLVEGRSELTRPLRKRAKALTARMNQVGRLRPDDFRAKITRRTSHYRDVLPLAKQLLRSEGRLLGGGGKRAWSFLIKTPDLVEDGLRNLVRESLAGIHDVEKRGKQFPPSSVSFTPDLVIGGGDVVADVKYSLLGSDWGRSHLYQIIAFAKAFDASQGIVLGFTESGATPPTVDVNGIEASAIAWEADLEREAGWARDCFLSDLRGRLGAELTSVIAATV